ncbi:MAG: NAD(P)H-binding protein [Bacteroidota bacterium]
MKNLLLTGATGMVGGIILREALQSDQVGKVTSIVRRASGQQHPKLVEVVHQDFTDYSNILPHFQQQDAACFCIGVYTGQVSNELFKKITLDFVQSFSDILHEQNPSATFCLLSGAGADQTEKSRVAFAKYKGMAENYLQSKDFGQLYLFRPAYIYPVEKREEPNFTYRISRRLYPVLKKLFPTMAITSERLAKAILQAALHGAPKTVLENEDIKQLVPES